MALLVDGIAFGLLEMFDVFSGLLVGALGVTLLVAGLGLICSRLSGFWWLSAIGTAASIGLLKAILTAFGGSRGVTVYYPSAFSLSLELPRDLGFPLVGGSSSWRALQESTPMSGSLEEFRGRCS